MQLSDAPNLGNVIVNKLIEAEIFDFESLVNLGAEQAFVRLVTMDEDCPPQMLYALEGAIQGMRWHNLDKERKTELKDFYNFISKK